MHVILLKYMIIILNNFYGWYKLSIYIRRRHSSVYRLVRACSTHFIIIFNMCFFIIQNQSMSLTPHLQGSTSPVSSANDGPLVPGTILLYSN